MKIALVHDYIKEYGGAERVLEALHEIWPKAVVFTSIYDPSSLGPHKERFATWDIKTSWLQQIPFSTRLISPLRLLAPFAFASFDFSRYDVVIVSATGAYTPNMIKKGKAVHICYCHTPPRYLYGFVTARDWKKNILLKVGGTLANHILRLIDYKSSQKVDYFIANSYNIAGRVKKFYRRDAVVIYPPVGTNPKQEIGDTRQETQNSKYKQSTSYFLAGGRLARAKNIKLIVETCAEQNIQLKVFGRGFAGYEKELGIMNYSPNIDFVGEVSDEEKTSLLYHAKAYIFAALDEDFGITPVEAMQVGTPVIAYRSGGVQESVIEGKTGIFFNKLSQESLFAAIKKFEKLAIDPKECLKQGEKFSKERFKNEIIDFINQKLGRAIDKS